MISKCTICENNDVIECSACGRPFCTSHLSKLDLLIHEDGRYCNDCLRYGIKAIDNITTLEDEMSIIYQRWIGYCKIGAKDDNQ
jgi:hypothetical protein